ncbi:hypothetical protein BGZ61DRAFT_175179 [Ilyonectria robusta]|uniref:uncharacterized protein n=1 Tax=Ilyonectria robusta TaxID=1079257 RepID=UPI001E8E6217|nr:uncharacterized protein BGZ61DRAFT_175179 [Ilyonectria robusta]KAH8657225.1 hypothetical protein BGZ61DRAFT_175179 [Ilyonectria robusta]
MVDSEPCELYERDAHSPWQTSWKEFPQLRLFHPHPQRRRHRRLAGPPTSFTMQLRHGEVRNLDFTTLTSNLDNTALEIVAYQRDSTVQRKDLAQKTRLSQAG